MAAGLGHDPDEADARPRRVVRGDVETGRLAVRRVRHLPPVTRRGAPVEEVELLLGRGVQPAGPLDRPQSVRVERHGVDPAQQAEDHRVVGLRTEGQPAGPCGQAAVRRPPVLVPLDQRLHAGRRGGCDPGLGGRPDPGDLAPVGGKAQFVLGVQWGAAQQFRARLVLPVGEVEPVEQDGLGVIGAGPPGGPGDDGVVAQGDPGPLGAVLPAVAHGGVAVPESGTADERGVLQGVEKRGVALRERANDQTGHEEVLRKQTVRSRSGRVGHRPADGTGARERSGTRDGAVARTHVPRLLPRPGPDALADTVSASRRTVQRIPDGPRGTCVSRPTPCRRRARS